MFTRYLLKTLALPPSINVLIILFALIFLGRWRRLRILLILFSSISLVFLSMPFTTKLLGAYIEKYPPLIVNGLDTNQYQAIIVLGSGRIRDAIEYGEDSPTAFELERMRYAVFLQRKTGLPILTTGGDVSEEGRTPEAEFMARVLEREFFATVRWQETQSRTTWENAVYSKKIADKQGIHKALLVTHAWHMPRSVYSFQQAGLDVTAAPTRFESYNLNKNNLFDFLPQANALRNNSLLLHELLGFFWYQWRGVIINA